MAPMVEVEVKMARLQSKWSWTTRGGMDEWQWQPYASASGLTLPGSFI